MPELRPLSETHARARAHEARRGWPRSYPDSPMVDEQFKLLPGVKRALVKFRRKHPFRLRGDEFVEAVDALVADLARSYRMVKPTVSHSGSWEGDSGSSTYNSGTHHITLRGRESVLTALHEFTHARGYGEHGAVWWSVNAFRLMFPRSFSRLRSTPGSHFLTRADHARGGGDSDGLAALFSALIG